MTHPSADHPPGRPSQAGPPNPMVHVHRLAGIMSLTTGSPLFVYWHDAHRGEGESAGPRLCMSKPSVAEDVGR